MKTNMNYRFMLAERDKEIERLNKEVEKYKKRCYEALTLIRENYGLLDKYGIDMLDDILNGKWYRMSELDINYNEIEDLDYCLELLEKRDKEIERLQKQIEEYQKALDETISENMDLHSIIKEVRERISKLFDNAIKYEATHDAGIYKELLEILDKENIW